MTTDQKHTPERMTDNQIIEAIKGLGEMAPYWLKEVLLEVIELREHNSEIHRLFAEEVYHHDNAKYDRDTFAAKVKGLEKDVEHYQSAYKVAHNQAMANGRRARELEAELVSRPVPVTSLMLQAQAESAIEMIKKLEAQRDELLDDLYYFLEGFNLSGHARKRLEEIYWSMEAKIEAEKQNETE